MPTFDRYIGIDYSGAQTPTSSLKGLRVYAANRASPPGEVRPPPSPRKYWTRRGIAEWLVERLSEDRPTIVGIDHGFSFPLRYFEQHGLPQEWRSFLDDFQRHWPTDGDYTMYRGAIAASTGRSTSTPRPRSMDRLMAQRRRGSAVIRFDPVTDLAE